MLPDSSQTIPPTSSERGCVAVPVAMKLWIYTNYDCNLSCSYCVAESSPQAPRRALGLETVRRLLDEAVEAGFNRVFFTGGEPFILDDIYEMLAYATARMETTVLTNGILLSGKRLGRLAAIPRDRLVVQVSLDGAAPAQHDAYRGAGTWTKTVAAIRRLQERGLRVRLATTETPANTAYLEDIIAFRRSLGISAADHIIRPLTRRGFSQEGMEVTTAGLVPEITVTVDGVFWHPLASPSSTDMQVSREIFPLAAALACIQQQVGQIHHPPDEQPRTVT